MYMLVSLSDVVQIHPSDFNKSTARCVETFINEKYADKVIHKVGLCVGFHSIISSSEGLIGHGSGLVSVNVDFRIVVYRPFKGEILLAKITGSDRKRGVLLSQGFFEDISVPPETLFEGTKFEKDEESASELFVWHSGEGESGAEQKMYFDEGLTCLYRAEEEQWHDLPPENKKPNQYLADEEAHVKSAVRKTPFLIRGSMMMPGLGPMFWWTDYEDGDEATGT